MTKILNPLIELDNTMKIFYVTASGFTTKQSPQQQEIATPRRARARLAMIILGTGR